MGLFGILKTIKNAKKAGGNFGYIAQNIATIYYVLKESEFGKQLNEDQLLFATALCDTISYVESGNITIEELYSSVIQSKIGVVSIFPYEVRHDSFLNNTTTKNKYLIGLTMQIEALIFSAEMLANYHDVVDSVVERKSEIAKMVNKTLQEGKKGNLYPAVLSNISIWLKDNSFRQIILDFDVYAL